jgi:hypothetical protein
MVKKISGDPSRIVEVAISNEGIRNRIGQQFGQYPKLPTPMQGRNYQGLSTGYTEISDILWRREWAWHPTLLAGA